MSDEDEREVRREEIEAAYCLALERFDEERERLYDARRGELAEEWGEGGAHLVRRLENLAHRVMRRGLVVDGLIAHSRNRLEREWAEVALVELERILEAFDGVERGAKARDKSIRLAVMRAIDTAAIERLGVTWPSAVEAGLRRNRELVEAAIAAWSAPPGRPRKNAPKRPRKWDAVERLFDALGVHVEPGEAAREWRAWCAETTAQNEAHAEHLGKNERRAKTRAESPLNSSRTEG